ncbi:MULTISPECIES: hypothetical protein [Microbacterium]|uniref:hypothetical protein n=1 Tax=Microbacterium TaxID=33882 RepID=UPI00300FC44F
MSDARPADGDATSREDVPAEDATIAERPGLQPETQGDEPLDADLGEEGQGDVGHEEDARHSGDAPDDLRTAGPSGPVVEEGEI